MPDVRGIPICGECNSPSTDGHRQGCSMKGVSPVSIWKKANKERSNNVRSTRSVCEKNRNDESHDSSLRLLSIEESNSQERYDI